MLVFSEQEFELEEFIDKACQAILASYKESYKRQYTFLSNNACRSIGENELLKALLKTEIKRKMSMEGCILLSKKHDQETKTNMRLHRKEIIFSFVKSIIKEFFVLGIQIAVKVIVKMLVPRKRAVISSYSDFRSGTAYFAVPL